MKVIDPYIVIDKHIDYNSNNTNNNFDSMIIKIINNDVVIRDFIEHFENLCTIINVDNEYYRLNSLTFIKPINIINKPDYDNWFSLMQSIENIFNQMDTNNTREFFENNILTRSIKVEFIIAINKHCLEQMFLKIADDMRKKYINTETIVCVVSLLNKLNMIYPNAFNRSMDALENTINRIKKSNIDFISVI